MPLAAPIGSGRGLKLRHAIEIMVEQAEVPVVVDAGLGAPSQAAAAMELGADAVLVNTAIARADDPAAMAGAFKGARRGRPRRPPRRADRGARERRDFQSGRRPRSTAVRDGAEYKGAGWSPSTAAPRTTEPGETIESLLDRFGLAARYALVERNGEPVERDRYGETAARGGRQACGRPSGRGWIAGSTSITAARPDLASFVEAAVRGGVDIVQIREKELADGALLSVLEQAREITHTLGVPLVVNDRPDLARLVEADYVHVGQADLPVAAARRFGVGVGQSTHAPAELSATEADYAGVDRSTRRRRRPAGLRPGSSTCATPPRTRACPGLRSAGSTRRTLPKSSQPARPGSRSSVRSGTPTIPRARPRPCGACSPETSATMPKPVSAAVPGSSIGRASGC